MRILLLLTLLTLTGCAAWQEMGETGQPPESWKNRYSAAVEMTCTPKLPRSAWNYFMGLLYAATNGGIDGTCDVQEPSEDETN